ncbi:MAG: AAA family ATPase, partial [Desulfofundulus sp.]
MRDLFPNDTLAPMKSQRGEIVATYDYRDEDGNLLFQVVRTEPKGFFQRRPDGKGSWVNRLDNVRLVPYRLPEVLEAVRRGLPVYVVEGEKDADNLARLGLVATTNPGGAGKWRPEFSEYLRGADVVILPDNDEVGKRHARQVAQSLAGKAASIKILELPDLPPKGDVSDWFAAAGPDGETQRLEELLRLAAEAPEWQPAGYPTGYSAAALVAMEFPEPRWCIPGLLPEGLTILAGKPKIGKSWMALNVAVAVASGGVALGQRAEAGTVVYLSLEDSPRRLKGRLLQVLDGTPAPAELYFYTSWPRMDEGGLSLLQEEIKTRRPRLVIVDTLARIRPQRKNVSDLFGTDYQDLAALKELADKYNVTLLIVHHLKKATELDPVDMVSGTAGITAAADAVWVLTRQRGQMDAT